MSLPRQHRLKRPKDFNWVYSQGRKLVSHSLVVRVAPYRQGRSPKLPETQGQSLSLSPTQFGISISQKVSKLAVERNLVKRRIKAAIRNLLPRLRPGFQVVILVRSGSAGCEYVEFLRQLEEMLKKLEVVDGNP